MLTKIDMAPTFKRIRQANPYIVNPQTKQIYGLYEVMVTWSDGTRKRFNSEEEARAYVEKRSVDQNAIKDEIPYGCLETIRQKTMPDPGPTPPPQEETATLVLAGVEEGKKVPIIKIVRELTGKNLKECKEIVENAPTVMWEDLDLSEAEKLKIQLEKAGAIVKFQ